MPRMPRIASNIAGADMSVFRLTVVVGSAILAGTACAGDGTGLEEFMPGGDQVTLSDDVQPIFTSNCALSGCHVGTNPRRGLNLSVGQTFANVVDVVATQSTINLVTPGQPDNSYLVHKVQGTHLAVGGSGFQMPLGRSPLTQMEIDLIRAWIAAGARPD